MLEAIGNHIIWPSISFTSKSLGSRVVKVVADKVGAVQVHHVALFNLLKNSLKMTVEEWMHDPLSIE